MAELTHEEALRFIHQPHLQPSEQEALREHLKGCESCRLQTAIAFNLAQNLVLDLDAIRPSSKFRFTLIERAVSHSRRERIMKPIYAVGGIAAIVLLALAGWFLFKPPDDQTLAAPPPEEAAPAAVLETAAPEETAVPPTAVPPTAVPPTATEPPAEPTAVPPTATAEPVAQLGGTAIIERIPSPALSGVIFGQDEEDVTIYLPPSYDSSEKHYPVLYVLAGLGDLEIGQYGLMGTFNPLFEQGDIPEMIIVIPDTYNGNNWGVHFVDSPLNGDWPSFITQDLVPYIDANYRSIPQAGARGLMGDTASGYGALNLAMSAPDTFGVIYLSHPWLFSPGGLEGSWYNSPVVVSKVASFFDAFSGAPPDSAGEIIADQEDRMLGNAGLTLAYGWDFAADPDADPPYFEYLYTSDGTAAAEEIWTRWENGFGDLENKVTAGSANLNSLAALAIAEGVEEQTTPWSLDGIHHLRELLDAQGIAYQGYDYEGDMYLIQSRLNDEIMPFFAENLTFE